MPTTGSKQVTSTSTDDEMQNEMEKTKKKVASEEDMEVALNLTLIGRHACVHVLKWTESKSHVHLVGIMD